MIPVSVIAEHVVSQVPRHYPATIDREHRIAGDELLLAKLSRWQLLHQAMTGPLPPVRRCDEVLLEAMIVDVQRYCLGAGIGWTLGGDQDAPIVDRIDVHFRPLQEAEEARRVEAERISAIQAESSAQLEADVIAPSLEADKRTWALP